MKYIDEFRNPELTKKLIAKISKMVSDYKKDIMLMEVCGTHTETYTSSTKGCDNMGNCECLHKSWGGLGSCESCECTREVSNC